MPAMAAPAVQPWVASSPPGGGHRGQVMCQQGSGSNHQVMMIWCHIRCGALTYDQQGCGQVVRWLRYHGRPHNLLCCCFRGCSFGFEEVEELSVAGESDTSLDDLAGRRVGTGAAVMADREAYRLWSRRPAPRCWPHELQARPGNY